MSYASINFAADDTRIHTNNGARQGNRIVVRRSQRGIVLYGPYVNLPPGRYQVQIELDRAGRCRGKVLMDVSADVGQQIVTSANFNLSALPTGRRRIELNFALNHLHAKCEVRLHAQRGAAFTILGLEIRCLDVDGGFIEHALANTGTRQLANAEIGERLNHIEHLSHGGRATYVGNNRVLTKVAIGNIVLGFLVPADDLLIVPHLIVHGDYEPDLTRYFVENIRPADHCLDIGANYGYYTCVMARCAPQGRTIGIEPSEDVFELLRDNININSLEAEATAMHAAVGQTVGHITLYRRSTRSGNTSIIELTGEAVKYLGEAAPVPFEIRCVTIDELLPQFDGRIDFIKIDVEGAEPLVLRGGKRTLEENPQVKMIMEWSPSQIRAAGFDVHSFIDEMKEMGLAAAVLRASGPDPIQLSDLKTGRYYSGILLTRAY